MMETCQVITFILFQRHYKKLRPIIWLQRSRPQLSGDGGAPVARPGGGSCLLL